jgi:integrase
MKDLAKMLRVYHEALGVGFGLAHEPDHLFFPGPAGRERCHGKNLSRTFHRVIEIAGIGCGSRGKQPRLHDLRHTFAVLRLLRWYEQGEDLSAKLPLLASYLGHIGLGSTQVYLHMTLDIAGEVVRHYEARFGDLIQEDG